MREGLLELFKATDAHSENAERPLAPVEDMPTVEAAYPFEAEPETEIVRERFRDAARGSRRTERGLPARHRSPRDPHCRVGAARNAAPARGPGFRMPKPDSAAYLAVIRVVGVGGGLNAVNRTIEAGISQVEFIGLNTDIQQLRMSDAPVKMHIGRERHRVLAPAPTSTSTACRRGRLRPDQARPRGSDMVFVTAGEGGGTGSGAAPVGEHRP